MIRQIAVFVAALASFAPLQARADFLVRSPSAIDFGEWEYEHNGSATFDRRPGQGGARSYTAEIGTGLTPWWHAEIELGFQRAPGPGQPTLASQMVLENTFQLTEPGEAFADFGFYFEYGQSLTKGRNAAANEVTFGPLIAKDIGRTTHTLNLLLTRLLGPDQTTHGMDFSYAWQSRWNLWGPLSPAIEIYGDTGVIGKWPRLSQQQLLAGPVAVGAIHLQDIGLSNAGKMKYEVGWLFGATPATTRGALRWRLELEVPF